MTINELILQLENPQIYTGREINAVHKSYADIQAGKFINICLVFPDKYEIGMSHYGLIVLYHLLNNMPGINAERCFLPGRESIALFKTHQVPLFSLESKTPLKDFDLIAFSLLSEMNYTNVLQILDLAQLPLYSRERKTSGPLIAMGGISAINPEPIRDFIDFFGIGEGEELFPDICATLELAKTNQWDRQTSLHHLQNIPGIYVPEFYPPVPKGPFFAPDMEPGTIAKRVYRLFDQDGGPVTAADESNHWIVPITSVVFDRLTIEMARGCPKNCRFCQAKSYYAPYRSRSLENVTHEICNGLAVTGFEAFSLSSLSTGDYPALTPLLESIPNIIPEGVSFSMPSLRPSTLSHHLLSTIALFKRTGLTIVPEAGTTRLRNVINKDVTDEEIFNAVEMALFNRWQKIKLYFMVGLPTETMEDIEGIVQMIRKIMQMAKAARQKVAIHASFSSFVPKPQTPLQWAAREDLTEILKKVKYIKEQLKPLTGRDLNLDIHTPENGLVETILARGDFRVGQLIFDAFQKGEIFSAWDSEFNYSVWAEMIKGSVYEEFLKEFSCQSPLPWDFLEVNFKAEYLKEEYQKALAGIPTPACDLQECATCQGCFHKIKRGKNVAEANRLEEPEVETPSKRYGEIPYNKMRLVYEKTGDFTFFSHLTMIKYLERLIRKTGIRFKCSEGFTTRIKITTLPALPVFATGLYEVVEVFLDATVNPVDILQKLHQCADPEGFIFKDVISSNETPLLTKDIHFLNFEIPKTITAPHLDVIRPILADTDVLTETDDLFKLTMDYAHGGQERFAKIYKLIDPEKKYTHHLVRTGVTFKKIAV